MDEDELNGLAWAFVRGDLELEALWAQGHDAERLLDLIGGHGGSLPEDLSDLRGRLARQLEEYLPGGCHCPRLRDREAVDLDGPMPGGPSFGPDVERTAEVLLGQITTLAERGAPHPWVSAAACEACGQGWLVGREDRHNDVLCLARIDDGTLEAIGAEDAWPETFETYEELLRLGRARGRFVEYDDPLGSPLGELVQDLASERPGIAVSDLEELLNIDSAVATALARRAMEGADCRITLDR